MLVVFFHAYARWPALMPYGDQYGDITLFKYGWLGVQLFFLISGFVILMTLEKCATAKEFLYRRWLRLFPAMLACTAIIYLTSNYFSERPAGIPNLESLLPGLTFIEPDWWSRILGHPVNGIEGAFWSLYVEFKFYLFAAIIYYWKNRNTLIRTLIFVFFMATCLRLAGKFFEITWLKYLDAIATDLSFRYFGWFASGAAFYIFSQNKSRRWFAVAFFAAIASSIADGGFDWHRVLAASIIGLVFTAVILIRSIQKILCNRVILFFGFISYPLYLLHENMMVSIIIKMGRNASDIPLFLLPLPATLLLSLAAFLVAKYLEQMVKFVLMMIFQQKPKLLGSR